MMHSTPQNTDSFWVEHERLLAGPYPGAATPADAEVKLAAFLDAGITCFIDLTEEGELRPYAHLLPSLAGDRDITVAHERHPIVDVSIPSPSEMRAILTAVDQALAVGERVYVHCWGGVGRTGTVLACRLVEQGRTAEAALQELAELRRHTQRAEAGRIAPETEEQRAFVRAWTVERDPE